MKYYYPLLFWLYIWRNIYYCSVAVCFFCDLFLVTGWSDQEVFDSLPVYVMQTNEGQDMKKPLIMISSVSAHTQYSHHLYARCISIPAKSCFLLVFVFWGGGHLPFLMVSLKTLALVLFVMPFSLSSKYNNNLFSAPMNEIIWAKNCWKAYASL